MAQVALLPCARVRAGRRTLRRLPEPLTRPEQQLSEASQILRAARHERLIDPHEHALDVLPGSGFVPGQLHADGARGAERWTTPDPRDVAELGQPEELTHLSAHAHRVAGPHVLAQVGAKTNNPSELSALASASVSSSWTNRPPRPSGSPRKSPTTTPSITTPELPARGLDEPVPWIAWIGVAGALHSGESAAVHGASAAPSTAVANPDGRDRIVTRRAARVRKGPASGGRDARVIGTSYSHSGRAGGARAPPRAYLAHARERCSAAEATASLLDEAAVACNV